MTERKERHRAGLTQIFTICLMLLPMLNIYASPIPSVSIGEIVMLLIVITTLLGTVRTIPFYKCYLAYCLISTLIISLALSFLGESYTMVDMLKRVLRDGTYFIILLFGINLFDYEYGKRCLKNVAVVLSCFMLAQFLCYALFKTAIPGIIPQMKTTMSGGLMGREMLDRFMLTTQKDGYMRANGFFGEPAICAHYLTIALIMELFLEKEEAHYKTAILFSLAILSTFSANGAVALGVCWGIWILHRKKNRILTPKEHRKRICMIVVLIASGIIILLIPATRQVIGRLFELGHLQRKTGSSGLRVWRGLAFYLNMPLFYQIFGIGFGNFLQFKEMYGITTAYEVADEYMSTNPYILCSAGLVGFCLYVCTLYKQVKNREFSVKVLFVMLLIFGISSSIYSTAQYLIMLIFIFAAPRKEKQDEAGYYNAPQHL